MKELMFTNDELNVQVRTIVLEEEVWFVARDVCDVLELSNITETLKRVDEEDQSSLKLNSGGQLRDMKIVNESGMYTIILLSNKPEAKKFKKWITSEVLPSIRKNGLYATSTTIDNLLANPDLAIELLTKLKEERLAKEQLQIENELNKKKINILTHVSKLYTATEIAKELNMSSAVVLNQKLNELKIQYKMNGTWIPYSNYEHLGYFSIKQDVLDNGHVIYNRKFTQEGREFILSLFN
jgi:prophage antirepressor-like protein